MNNDQVNTNYSASAQVYLTTYITYLSFILFSLFYNTFFVSSVRPQLCLVRVILIVYFGLYK